MTQRNNKNKSSETTHSISVGGIVVNPKGEVLLVKQHGSLGPSWTFPKGRIESIDKNSVETARREIEEETGVFDIHFVQHLCSYQRPFFEGTIHERKNEVKHIELMLFITRDFRSAHKISKTRDEEMNWISIDEVSEYLTFPSDRREFINHLNIVNTLRFTKVDDDLSALTSSFKELVKRVELLEKQLDRRRNV